MDPKARRLARQYALQALYQWQLSQAPPAEIEDQFLKHQQMNKKTDMAYFKELVHGVPKQQSELDALMSPFLKRNLHELDPIELSILRLSTYELHNRPEVPFRVIINEALELTKMFGSIEGHKFVNGVLDHVAQQIRPVEINAHKNHE